MLFLLHDKEAASIRSQQYGFLRKAYTMTPVDMPTQSGKAHKDHPRRRSTGT